MQSVQVVRIFSEAYTSLVVMILVAHIMVTFVGTPASLSPGKCTKHFYNLARLYDNLFDLLAYAARHLLPMIYRSLFPLYGPLLCANGRRVALLIHTIFSHVGPNWK